MRVEITAEDIAEGVPRSHCKCPAAIALSRVTGKDVSVGTSSYVVGGRVYDLPNSLGIWIVDFDFGQPVRPTTFEVPDVRE